MSDDPLKQMEQALVANPFDNSTRMDYAAALLQRERASDALQQYELAMQAAAETAAPVVGAALCQLKLDNPTAALDLYTRSKNLGGFEPVDELETLKGAAQPSGPQLGVVSDAGNVTPLFSSDREKVSFNDVAGMDKLKKTLRIQIIEPFRNPGVFKRFRKKAGGGVLLYGPPGCGKTLMARAVATECKAEFMLVGISDVLNMWLGESERNLAELFAQARSRKPCVMFFDELDALAYARSKANSSSSRTVVNEFLNQLDGFDADNDQVLILAATNMPWDVDPAIKRPGRFARQIFVPPPDDSARLAMLEMKLTGVPSEHIDLNALSAATNLFSGADMDGLIELAKESAIADMIDGSEDRVLRQSDFAEALEEVTPTTVEWLKTARNLVKYSGADNAYKDVEKYLKQVKMY